MKNKLGINVAARKIPTGRKPLLKYESMMFIKMIKSCLGLDMEKEYRFHPSRKWRFDYAIPSLRMAIEVEGGVWTGGRHTSSKGFLGDMEKYNEAALLGWCLVRTTPAALLTGATIELIKRRKKVMSQKKQIIELASDGIGKEELLSFPPVPCPQCAGRGHFTEEVSRQEVKETPCPYCEGKGRVFCTAHILWQPYGGEESIIRNLKELYHEMEKRTTH